MPKKLFEKGNPGGPGRPPLDESVKPEEGVSERLGLMRKAASWSHRSLPRSPRLRTLVKMRDKTPLKFEEMLDRLEREHEVRRREEASGASGGSVGERVDDETGKRVVGEIEVWLERMRASAETQEKEIRS